MGRRRKRRRRDEARKRRADRQGQSDLRRWPRDWSAGRADVRGVLGSAGDGDATLYARRRRRLWAGTRDGVAGDGGGAGAQGAHGARCQMMSWDALGTVAAALMAFMALHA